MDPDRYLHVIDEKKQLLEETSDLLWDWSETAFLEFRSAAYLKEVLKNEGFQVEEDLAGIRTAFSGRFGSGKPVIGFLGEFDALSGLAQEAGKAVPAPIPGITSGQGCGHNLLGTGALASVLALKEYLVQTGRSGTVIYYGCPAEEGGSGKAFMARDGVFDELDAAIAWHPGSTTKCNTDRQLANCQILYRFDGVPSHAGAKPHLGRSALDALELMNVGVQFLREHMPPSCRVHYAITDTGGFSPNVVQGHAEAVYLIRGANNGEVEDLYARVNRIAQGAALMTDTKESHEFIKACSNTVTNLVLSKLADESLRTVELPEPDEEEIAFARAIAKTVDGDPERPIHQEIRPLAPSKQVFGSTDVGDVSWVCPTVRIYAATMAYKTPGHSWQLTAQGKSSWAKKMTRYIGKVMAEMAVRLMEDPSLLEAAWEEHRENVGPKGYEAPIPKGVVPKPLQKDQ